MASLVFFHAHPDDECIQTAGAMALAADAGHRVVLVVATKGEHGEVADGFLDPGESLADRRVAETHAAAKALGVERVEFLGYVDSGMIDTDENAAPESFWQADVDEAAERLAAILRAEDAEVLTTYDDHGGYGHPDHIQVHRVGHRAAELAGTPRVYEATMNRDEIARLMAMMPREEGEGGPPDLENEPDFGSPEAIITCRVDVRAAVDRKREAMRAHASQIGPEHFMLAMPDEAFAMAFGTEWYIRAGQGPGITETTLL